MAKEKKSKEELKSALGSAKEERKVASEELRNFEKEHKLAKGEDHSKDEKHGKRWSKLKEMHTKKDDAVKKAQEAYDEAKKEKVARASKYEYPLVDGKEMTAAEKKKYRAEMRRKKNKKDKGEEGEGKEGGSKKKDKGNKKKDKGDKKKEKSKPAAEEEDDDDDDED